MVIITTVGTSLLTNLIPEDTKNCFGDFNLGKSTSTNIAKGTLTSSNSRLDKAIIKFIEGEKIKDCQEFNNDNTYEINIDASAEIKSICKIANGQLAKVYLLCTDTFMSKYCGEKIKDTLNERLGLEFPKEPLRIESLKIDDPENFQNTGFESLIAEIDKICEDEKDHDLVLNISGGYKALIPFLTIYGQLKKIPLKYIYENSDEIISIGKTPLDFDWSVAEIYSEYLTNSKLRKKLGRSDEIFSLLLKNNFINESKKLTGLGSLFSQYINKYLPQRQDVLGHYMEHKLFEAFFEKDYKEGFRANRIGREFYWDGESRYFNKEQDKTNRVEIDVELKNEEGNLIWFESKAYSQLSTAIKQVKKYINFNENALKACLKEVIIFTYKFEFQNINPARFSDLITFCNDKGITFSVLYWNVPFNKEKGSITYKKIFETKLKLRENLKFLKLKNN